MITDKVNEISAQPWAVGIRAIVIDGAQMGIAWSRQIYFGDTTAAQAFNAALAAKAAA